MSGLGGRVGILAVTVAVVVVGGALLRSAGGAGGDPAASVGNGGPRGLLGLGLLLAAEGTNVEVSSRFDLEPSAGGARATSAPRVVLVPPPERTPWSETEAQQVLERVAAGHRIVILCDEEEARTARLGALLAAVGAECFRADIAIGDDSVTTAASVFDEGTLFVRGAGRARPRPRAPLIPFFVAGTEAVVLIGPHGAGDVVVVGSATVLANDGLAERGNAAFGLGTLAPPGAVVEVDERHHGSRASADWWAAAGRGLGPVTALVALALLVPLSLLSLAPRPGDAPPRDDGQGAPAALAQARALAALLDRVRDASAPR